MIGDCEDLGAYRIPLRPEPIRQVAVCLGCGGFCKGPEHTPLMGKPFGLFGGVAYSIPSPAHIRPIGLALWGHEGVLVKAIRTGGVEHLAARNVPWNWWATAGGRRPAELAELAAQNLADRYVAPVDIGTVLLGEAIYIEVTDPIRDAMLIGFMRASDSSGDAA
jgi:hypothetical protein